MVADYLNTSVYIVTRLFKDATGKNFKEYVLDKRMEYAQELLRTTPTKIAEISSLAGFDSPEYFSSVFKSKYGITPTQYRKSQSWTYWSCEAYFFLRSRRRCAGI